MNPSDPRAVRVILRWLGSDPRPIYLGTLLQQLHLQPVAVLEFLTAMMDYVAARGSILATRIEGWGSIGDMSPAPPHCQQVAAEAPAPPACAPPVQPQPPNPHPAPQTAPKPEPKPQRPPKREPKSAPKPTLKKGRGSWGSPPRRSRPGTPQRTPPRGPPPTPRRSRSPNPAPRPRSPPTPLARLPREPRPPNPRPSPPNPNPRPSQRQEGGVVQIQSGGASLCRVRDNGQWGIEQGKEALAAGGPPGVGETWIAFPKDPELFAIPRASVWKTKT